MTYYVYINGTHTDTVDEAETYTAADYYRDYNINWGGQPEELTDEVVKLVAMNGSSESTTYQRG